MRELAHFARTTHATVQRIENGSLDASAQIKARIARTLRVPCAELWPTESDAPGRTGASQKEGDEGAVQLTG
jgi:DNA-binding XRE family transcriptional regulator